MLFSGQRSLPEVELGDQEESRRVVVADLFQFYPEDMKSLHPLGTEPPRADEEQDVPIAETVSDEKGEFTFERPPPTRVRLYAEKGALASAHVLSLPRGRAPTLVLKSSAGLKGRVRSSDDGRMVQGALVRVVTGGRVVSMTTGPDGAFEFKGLPASPVTVFATHADYAGDLRKGVLLEGSKVTELMIGLTKGYRLRIKVEGETEDPANDVPVAGATVGAYRVEDQGYVLGKSDDEGMVVFEGLPPGVYLVNAEARGFLPAGEEKVPLQADREWELLLEKAVLTKLIVVDERDVPVAEAELWTGNLDEEYQTGVSRKVGKTNRDGEFSFPFDWDGKDAALFIAKAGLGMTTVIPDDPSEGEPIKVKLKRGSLLRGRVTNVAGDPIEGAEIYIEATPDDIEEEDLYATLYTDSNGEYRFPYLPPGEIWIDVTADGYDGDDSEIESGSTLREHVRNFMLEKE
jgi:hypothetical protein